VRACFCAGLVHEACAAAACLRHAFHSSTALVQGAAIVGRVRIRTRSLCAPSWRAPLAARLHPLGERPQENDEGLLPTLLVGLVIRMAPDKGGQRQIIRDLLAAHIVPVEWMSRQLIIED